MKLLLALSGILATATALKFQAYTAPNWQGQTRVINQQGFYYLTPPANSYSFDSEDGKWAIRARSDGPTEETCITKDNLETDAPLNSVEIVEAATANWC